MPSMGPAEPPGPACGTCDLNNVAHLTKLGTDPGGCDVVIALAGNPNTGKSTVFNALTGLRQHVGNWPGTTVSRAEGAFSFRGRAFKLVDLPGTYSLLSTSRDEEVARNHLLFGRPDVTVVVVDATRLERNLNLVLQILQITARVVVALNLMDEAGRHGIEIDERHLARELGVPVVPMAARRGQGVSDLLGRVAEMASASRKARPRRQRFDPVVTRAVDELARRLVDDHPGLVNAQWVALRLLEGDAGIERAVRDGSLGDLARDQMDWMKS
jgi:ferrous iron transport protein B